MLSLDNKMESYEIWLNGEFNRDNTALLRKEIIKSANESEEKPIIVYINSHGGYVDMLTNLLDTFDSVPNKIITVACGTAMSCGAILLSAGDVRYATPNTRMMIHKVSGMSFGNADDLKNSAAEIDRLNDKIMEILAKNCGKTMKQLNSLLKDKRDVYMSSDEAVKFGLVDKIGFPRLIEKKSFEIKLF